MSDAPARPPRPSAAPARWSASAWSARVSEAAVRAAFRRQAEYCDQLGSPLTAEVCRHAADLLHTGTPLGARILGWAAEPNTDALPLRLAAGLHALVRADELPELAACYPPYPPGGLREALAAALDHPALPAWLDHPPQTNEVGRSAMVMAGLSVIAAETGAELELLELGCSAGLNLFPDRYAIDLGGAAHGDPASPVRLTPDWRGNPPPRRPVRIAVRRGVDLVPLSPHDPGARARLLAYVWADQPDRLARMEAALRLAASAPPVVDRGDAGEWAPRMLTRAPVPGRARVLFDTMAFHYFDAAATATVRAAAARAADVATTLSPFAWLRFEFAPDHVEAPSLRLTVWPGGEDRLLAHAAPHGQWIDWHATATSPMVLV